MAHFQESVLFEAPSITAENLIENETIDHQQEPMTEAALDQELKSSVSRDEIERDNTDQEVVSSARYNHQEDQVKRSTTKTKFGNHVQHALVLFALGLICALIALLVYFAISTATDAIVLILMVLVFLGAAGLAILLPLMGLMILLGVTLGRNKLS